MCRPTKSRALYFQQIGRGLRLSPETGKRDCVVLDHAGNVSKFGFVEDLKEVNLFPGKDTKPHDAPTKICPDCGAILYTFVMRCDCGYVFPRDIQLSIQVLVQLLSEEDRKRLKNYHKLYQQAYQQGYAPGWADTQFKDKYGYWPPRAWGRGAVFGDCPTQKNKRDFRRYLQSVAQRKEKPEDWVKRYLTLEFG